MNVNIHKHKRQTGFSFHKNITNCQGLVPGLLDDVGKWLVQTGIPHGKIIDVQIVIAEALNNVIEHGFPFERSGHVSIDIDVKNNVIVAKICDNGKEFTPPETKETPLQGEVDLEDLPEGGFGWLLIREITTSFTFRRVAHENRLVLNFC